MSLGRTIRARATSQSTVIRFVDSVTGAPEEGVDAATGGLSLWYRREGGLLVAISPSNLTLLTDAYSSGGLLHIDDGWYRLDVPDAAFDSGVDGVQVGGTATGMVAHAQYHSIDRYARTDLACLLESNRGAHTHQGAIFYVDPVNGDTHANGNRGGLTDPYDSIQDCHDNAVTDSAHDLIILISGAAGVTTLTEDVTLSKRYLLIRGPGRDFVWTRSGNGDTISVTADGIELSGFQLETAATGSGHGIQLTDADFLRAHNLWVNQTRGDGINILRGSNCQIHNNHFQESGQGGSGQGVHIVGTAGSSDLNKVFDNIMIDCAGDGILIEQGTTNNTLISGNVVEGSTGWGINVGSSSTDAVVIGNCLGNNASGNIQDLGATTIEKNNSEWASSADLAAMQAQMDISIYEGAVWLSDGASTLR